jgi:HK97 family phage prohead protease
MTMKKLSRPFEVKSLEDDGHFTGYGAVFGNEDSYGDVIEQGAFKDSLSRIKRDKVTVPILWQHESTEPLGPFVELSEDEKGLFVEGRLLVDDDPLAKRAHAHLKAKSISGLSIGYTIPKGGGMWNEDDGTYMLSQINLWEVSLVTFPANDLARIEDVKCALRNEKQFERFLRDAGLSRTQAKGVMAHGYGGLNLREADSESSEAITATLAAANKFIESLKE